LQVERSHQVWKRKRNYDLLNNPGREWYDSLDKYAMLYNESHHTAIGEIGCTYGA
jgi:hypothetical protein